MFVERIRLKNWCQHKEIDVELGQLTSLRGPNGSGKSNLVNGLVFALTETLRVPGVKLANVSKFAAAKEESGVWVNFSHGGSSCELHRGLVPNRQYLSVNGGAKITKNPDVRAALRDLLGVDASLLLDYVFVEQRQMHSFISQKDEDRAAAFSQLFGTAKAEKIWDHLGSVKVPEVLLSVDGPAVRQELAGVKEALALVRAASAAASERLDVLEAGSAARHNYVQAHRLRQMRFRDVVDLEPRVNKAVLTAAKAEAELRTVDDVFIALVKPDKHRRDIEEAKETLRAWAAYRVSKDDYDLARLQLRQAESDLAAAKKVLETLPTPPGYLPAGQRPGNVERTFQLGSALTTLKNFVSKCDPDAGVAACPTCGTPTSQPDLHEKVEKAKVSIKALLDELRARQDALKVSEAHDVSAGKLQNDFERANYAANLYARQLADKTEPKPPVVDFAMARASLKDAEAGLIEAERLVQRRQELADLAMQLRADASALQHQLEVFGRALSELPPTTEEGFSLALSDQRAHDELKANLPGLEARETLLEANEARCVASLKTYEAEHARYWASKKLKQHLEEVRSVFHRDRLQASVSQYYLGAMLSQVNDVLVRFDAPFRASSVDKLRFTVRHADGRETSAERLSEGEKIVLALAFRLVVNSMFASELGLLCLDEPTAGLDENNLGCLGVALDRLREVGKARGLQVLLVTHEKGLDAFCDKTVELAAG